MPQLDAASTNAHRFAEQSVDVSTPAAGFVKLEFKSTGVYAVLSTGAVVPIKTYLRELQIPASNMWPSTTAGSAALAQTELATNKVNFKSLDFDQTTQEHAEFNVWMPADWNAGSVTFAVSWTAASGAGTVTWALQGRSLANDDAMDGAWGTAVTVTDTLLAADDMHVSPTSSAVTIANTPSAGEWVQFRIYRDISDTLTADAKLLGVKLYYT